MDPRCSHLRMSPMMLATADELPQRLRLHAKGGAARTFPARRQAGSRLHLHVKGDRNANAPMRDEPQHLQPRMGPRGSHLRMSHTAPAPTDKPHDACNCGRASSVQGPARQGGVDRPYPARPKRGSRVHLHVKGDHNASMRPEPKRWPCAPAQNAEPQKSGKICSLCMI